jgi:hypothetical protein
MAPVFVKQMYHTILCIHETRVRDCLLDFFWTKILRKIRLWALIRHDVGLFLTAEM